MDSPGFFVILVAGQLSEGWSAWFDGLAVRKEANGETSLSGVFCDQAALFGTLAKIHALNLELVSVVRIQAGTKK